MRLKHYTLKFLSFYPAFLAVLALIWGGCSAGQPGLTLTGTVTDAQSGKPVAGAWVGDADGYGGSPSWGSYTDYRGQYSYQTWYEEHNIRAQAPNYQEQRKLLKTFILKKEKEKVIDFSLQLK